MCTGSGACGHTHTAESQRPVRRYVGFTAAETAFVALCCHGFNWVFHNRYCGFLFNCGCTWEWDGGWASCNVHNPTGPRCPWCAAGNPPTPGFNSTGAQTLSQWVFSINQYLVTFLMVVSWAVAFYLQTRRGRALRHNLYFQQSPCTSDTGIGSGEGGDARKRKCCENSGKVYERAPAHQSSRGLKKAVSVGGGEEEEETELPLREVADPRGDRQQQQQQQQQRGSLRVARQEKQRLPLPFNETNEGEEEEEEEEEEDRKRARTRSLLFVLRAFVVPFATFGVYDFLVALGFFAASDYPYFMWFNATARQCGGIDFPC